MTRTLTLACALLMAPAASASEKPSHKLEELRIQARAAAQLEESMCTADGVWCVARPVAAPVDTSGDVDRSANLTVTYKTTGKSAVAATIPLFETDSEFAEAAPWPSIIRLKHASNHDVALVGILRTQRQMYAGGGGSATHLTLYEVSTSREQRSRPVATIPYGSSIQIRACFDEDDMKRRRDACSDEYTFSSTLTLDTSAKDTLRLAYKSHAETYPGVVSRDQDSTAAPPLKEEDLQPATNAQCSFERTLTRNVQSGLLEWNEPPPACTDFLEP